MLIPIGIIIYCYAYVAKYSVLTTDDFCHYAQHIAKIALSESGSLIETGINYAKSEVLSFGGRYFSVFIQALLGPRPGIDMLAKNRAVLMSNVYVYFGGLFFLIYSLYSNLLLYKKKTTDKVFASIITYFFIIVLHNFYSFYKEVFTWLSGATSYTIPMSMFFIALSLVLYSYRYKSLLIKVLAIIFIIASMGGSISVTGFAFGILLTLSIYLLLSKGLSIELFVMLLQFLIFALFGAMAPGNFKRLFLEHRKLDDQSFTLSDILLDSFEKIGDRINTLYEKPWFIIVFIITIFLISILIYDKKKKNIAALLSLISIVILPIAVVFTFILGYGVGSDFGDRCFFMIDISLIIAGLVLGVMILTIMSRYLSLPFAFMFTLSILIVLLVPLFNFKMTDDNTKAENNEERMKTIFIYDKDDYIGIQFLTVRDDMLENNYKIYYDKFADTMDQFEKNRGTNYAIIRYPAFETAPEFLMPFLDMRLLLPDFKDEDYVPYFYDIKGVKYVEYRD